MSLRSSGLRGSLFLTAAAVACMAGPAWAQTKTFNVPAQDAVTGIPAFARQAGVQILAAETATRGRRTRAVVGAYTLEAGLERLLAGTGLEVASNDGRTVTLQPIPPAEAAPIAAAEPATLGELIVTAQKREERLIDAPQAVSVITNADVQRWNAIQFADFASQVPGLSFTTSGAGQAQVSLRGVSAGNDISPTVGIYLDEVPYGSSTPFAGAASLALDVALFDIERIEVLRGPQGTLYGASSMGGLIKYVTRKPGASDFGGEVRAGLSSTHHGRLNYHTGGSLNAPLGDTVAVRGSAFYSRDGGYIDNVARRAEDVNQSKVYGGRLDVLMTPSDPLSIRLTAMVQEIERDGRATADFTLAGANLRGPLTQSRGTAEPFDQSFQLASATVAYDLGAAELTSITSYQRIRTAVSSDLTPVYVPLLANFGRTYSAAGQDALNRTKRFTQEARLASAPGRLEWLVGAYYTKEDSFGAAVVVPLDPSGRPATPDIFSNRRPSDFSELAAFGNVTFKLTDRFDVSLGLRYAENELKTSNVDSGLLAAPPQALTTSSDNVVNYLANARYRLTDRATAYVRYATGYRPGGPNFTTLNPATGLPNGPTSFSADSLDSYEVGLHAETPDRRFGVDLALYYIDWSNIQVSVFRGGFGGIVNAPGGATVHGVELALLAKPTPDLSMTVSITRQNAELTEASPLDLRGAEGERIPNVPDLTATLNLDYQLPFARSANATVGGTVRYVSDRTSGFSGSPFTYYRFPDYTTVDLRAAWDIGSVRFQVFARNVTDERAQLSALVLGGPRVTILQPRTIGVSLSAPF